MQPTGAPDPDDIDRLIRTVDVARLLLSFDAAYDVPLRQSHAIGLLHLRRAAKDDALLTRVGEAWCDVVRCDVEMDLRRGLVLVDASRDDARRLRATSSGDGADSYVAARWHDGAGRILYRTASHARARIEFETATRTAEDRHLWWCLPDMRSNLLRASWEEARQAGTAAAVVEEIERAVVSAEGEATARGIVVDDLPATAVGREFVRGFSSLLHNLAVVLLDTDPAGSLRYSERASAISQRLGDAYRLAQAVNHQAHLAAIGGDPLRAVTLYERVRTLEWVRGRRIAEQNLAKLRGGRAGARALANLLATIADEGGPAKGSAGLDVDLRQYTVLAYVGLTESLAGSDATPHDLAMRDDARARELELARSVRQVVALPAYKRTYGMTVRPIYLRRIAGDLAASAPSREHWEDVLALVEESAGRELLDMISSAALPLLGPPAPATTSARAPAARPEVTAGDRRRAAPRRSLDPQELEEDRLALLAREQEFESQFLRRPLAAAPHDAEIANTAERYAVNHPGTTLVRYFAHGFDPAMRRPLMISAFVIRDSVSTPILCAEYPRVQELVTRLLGAPVPTATRAREIWELLIEPLWPAISAPAGAPGDPHLVIVPSDDLFAVPFHIASRDGYDSRPLGALVPLSQTVSLTAFLTRGRHLLRRQQVAVDDDLAALVVRDAGVSARELVETGWDPEHLAVVGDAPPGLGPGVRARPAGWAGLAELAALRPEFFLYAGHGRYHPSYGELGPYLDMRDGGHRDRLTPYDVALRIRLSRNRLTILAACLAGQGTSQPGGDVGGFLRAFIAAGAGVIAMPLWEVLDPAIATTAGHLLAASRRAVADSRPYDAVGTLHEHYSSLVESTPFWIDHMPLALYT